jgi:hypothetical protein
LAVDPYLRRPVALKVPGPEALTSISSRDRFLSEAQAVAILRHPNIVSVHEAGEAGHIPYMVMDYCEGGTLANWLADKPANWTVLAVWAARLVAQIARGVQHAHDRGILHRDLKPSNILLQPVSHVASTQVADHGRRIDAGEGLEFVPQVADFGLAKVHDSNNPGRERTLQGVPLGTLPYMSSEAARGDGAAISPATDVYGLGAILFELLTRRRPFAAASQAELLDQVLNAEPRTPRQFRKDVPRDLETICLKCLQKDRRDRYQSPSEVANELQRFLNKLPILARPAPLWRRAAVRLRRHPVGWMMVGLLLTTAIAWGTTAAWVTQEERRRETEKRLSQLETAEVASLPDIIGQLGPSDARTAERLGSLFVGGTQAQKLAAAMVLAKTRDDYRTYCYNRLLEAGPREIEPISRLLNDRMPGLSQRLEREMKVASESGSPSAEDHDIGRANAACALIALGNRDRGWSLLGFTPDPQARSFLIHLLGPAGIAPERIVAKIDAESDPSIRRALIQSLGGVPDISWSAETRRRAESLVLGLYQNDPDPGIHGSAKWLLHHWNRQRVLAEIDQKLARAGSPREGFRWRVSRSGLTFVTIDDPSTGRVIEVSDTEVPRDLFLGFIREHRYPKEACPEPDCPIINVSYIVAAKFCNALTDLDGLGSAQRCYGKATEKSIEPVVGASNLAGYRLLTDSEFLLVCRAGTTTRRYYGNSMSLLPKYAW